MERREKTKAIRSCSTLPGRISTQKPTRKSLRSKRECAQRELGARGGAEGWRGERALFPRLDQLPREPDLVEVEREEAERPAERRRLLVEDRPVGPAEEHLG